LINHRLKGKNVVITGASSGIGEKIAKEAAACGANVVLLARSRDKLEKISTDITSKTTSSCCYTYTLDVSDLEAVQQTFENIFATVGTVDVLVNNAGFGIFDTVLDASLEDMKTMFEVNVFGLIACTKMVLPKMVEQNAGHIINIASQAGKIATPKSSIYSATKHAVLGFTNSLRLELAGTNVYVTAVNPGPIRTNFFNVADKSGSYVKNVEKYMLDPEDVAKQIVGLMFTRKRELNLPRWMNAGSVLYQLFPTAVEKIAGNAFYKK
jgi:uncharacterized protein